MPFACCTLYHTRAMISTLNLLLDNTGRHIQHESEKRTVITRENQKPLEYLVQDIRATAMEKMQKTVHPLRKRSATNLVNQILPITPIRTIDLRHGDAIGVGVHRSSQEPRHIANPRRRPR